MHTAINQHFLHMLYSRFLLASGVSVDSRTLQPGQIFFALDGAHHHGEDFVDEAMAKGASGVVTTQGKYPKDKKRFVHKNPLLVLQALASFHRAQYRHKVIAITGTNGKTTTRYLTHAVLSRRYSTQTAMKNFNNHIGVPLTLLCIHPQLEFLVLEFGSSAPGEIALLCEIARPTHGVITNVGRAHLACLKNEQGVQKEKKVLYTFLAKNGGEVFLNTGQVSLKTMLPASLPILCHTYPAPSDNHPLLCCKTHPHLVCQLPERAPFSSLLMGQHNFENIATAAAIGGRFNVPAKDIETALSTYTPTHHRSQWMSTATNRLLVDAYNANPTAMEAVLTYWDALQVADKAVILGDMNELGAVSTSAHRALGDRLQAMDLRHIVLCGTAMKAAKLQCQKALYFPSTAAFIAHLKENPWRGLHILLKASRSLRLEETIPYL